MGKKRERTMLEALLADQARTVRPRAASRRSSDPPSTQQCCTCNEVSKGVAAAERHVDTARHYRYKQVFEVMPH